MSRSKAEVDLVVSQRQASQAFNDLAAKMQQASQQMGQSLNRVNEQAKDGDKNFDKWGTGIQRLATNLKGAIAGFASIASLATVIRQQVQMAVEASERARSGQFTVEAGIREMEAQLPPGSTLPTRVRESAFRSSDPTAAFEMFRNILSAAGTPETNEQAFEIGKLILDKQPELLTTGSAAAFGGALFEVQRAAKDNLTLDERREQLNAAIGSSRQNTPEAFSTNVVPAITELMRSGGYSFPEAAAFANTLSTLGVDVQGAQTRTQLIKTADQLKTTFRKHGVSKDGQDLQGFDQFRFLLGEGEFAGEEFQQKREAILQELGGLRFANMTREEMDKVLESAKTGNGIRDEAIKGKLTGEGHLVPIIMSMFKRLPSGALPESARMMFEAAEAIPAKEEAAKRIAEREKGARERGRIGLDVELARKQFGATALSDDDRFVQASSRELMRDLFIATGGNWSESLLQRGLMTMDHLFGADKQDDLKRVRRVAQERQENILQDQVPFFSQQGRALRDATGRLTEAGRAEAFAKLDESQRRQIEATERLIHKIDQLLSGVMKTEVVGDRTKRQAAQQPPKPINWIDPGGWQQ